MSSDRIDEDDIPFALRGIECELKRIADVLDALEAPRTTRRPM